MLQNNIFDRDKTRQNISLLAIIQTGLCLQMLLRILIELGDKRIVVFVYVSKYCRENYSKIFISISYIMDPRYVSQMWWSFFTSKIISCYD